MCKNEVRESRNNRPKIRPSPPQIGAFFVILEAYRIKAMNQLSFEENIIRIEIESWRAFANGMRDEDERKEFEEMVNMYHKYSRVVINAGFRPFSSKHLILTLLFFQYRKIMQWLFNKTASN
jgi:hypothetical protein